MKTTISLYLYPLVPIYSPPHHHKIRSHSLNHRSNPIPYLNIYTHNPLIFHSPSVSHQLASETLCVIPQPPTNLLPSPPPITAHKPSSFPRSPYCWHTVRAKLFCHAKHEKIYYDAPHHSALHIHFSSFSGTRFADFHKPQTQRRTETIFRV